MEEQDGQGRSDRRGKRSSDQGGALAPLGEIVGKTERLLGTSLSQEQAAVVEEIRAAALGAIAALEGSREEAAPAAGDDEEPASLRILVADDNAVNRTYLTGCLTRLGHRFTAVADGRELIEQLRCGHYDALLTDLSMPGISGLDALAAIRSGEIAVTNPSIPAIAVSAVLLPEEKERLVAAGFDRFLSKPVDMQRLADALSRLSSRIRGERREGPDGLAQAAPAVSSPTCKEPRGPELSVEELIDVEYVRANFEGMEDVLRELSGIYRDELPSRLRRIGSALETRDSHAAYDAAHELKGASLNLGIAALARVCAEIEAAARRERFDEASSRFEVLEKLARQVVENLESLLEAPFEPARPMEEPPEGEKGPAASKRYPR